MVDFFQRMELKEIVEIANAANYLDMARLLDASLAALALHQRRVVFQLDKGDELLLKVSLDEDKVMREQFF